MCFMKGSLREGAPAKRVREPARHRQSTCKKASQDVKSKNFKVTQAPSVTHSRATFLVRGRFSQGRKKKTVGFYTNRSLLRFIK